MITLIIKLRQTSGGEAGPIVAVAHNVPRSSNDDKFT